MSSSEDAKRAVVRTPSDREIPGKKLVFMTSEDRDGMMQSGMEAVMNESYAALDRLLSRMA